MDRLPLADATAPITAEGADGSRFEFPPIRLDSGPLRLEAFIGDAKGRPGIRFAEIERIAD